MKIIIRWGKPRFRMLREGLFEAVIPYYAEANTPQLEYLNLYYILHNFNIPPLLRKLIEEKLKQITDEDLYIMLKKYYNHPAFIPLFFDFLP